MIEEMKSIQVNKTWVLVTPLLNKRIFDYKYGFKVKEGMSYSEPFKFKDGLVAKAFTQVKGVDYNEIFSSVVIYTKIRTVLALNTHFTWELEQLDAKNAFLHGDLEETKYMRQHEGFKIKQKYVEMICLLKKFCMV